MKKLLISTLMLGGLAGGALMSNQLLNVSAAEVDEVEVEERNEGWNFEDHRNQMADHMNSMHGRRGRRQSDRIRDREDLTEEQWLEHQEFMEERHNSMWDYRNEDRENGEYEDTGRGNPFYNHRRQHMNGFGNQSFEDRFEWMEEMHETIFNRKGMRYWFQNEEREDLEDEDFERPFNRGFMRRFNREEND